MTPGESRKRICIVSHLQRLFLFFFPVGVFPIRTRNGFSGTSRIGAQQAFKPEDSTLATHLGLKPHTLRAVLPSFCEFFLSVVRGRVRPLAVPLLSVLLLACRCIPLRPLMWASMVLKSPSVNAKRNPPPQSAPVCDRKR
jgi:hypothetical protein